MTGKEAEIIGKPSESVVETVTDIKDVSPENCLIIGDRLNTDIVMGNENGMETVLVLSGVTDREELKESYIEPDHVLDSIAYVDEIF
jgi:arabinose operon protein AraL